MRRVLALVAAVMLWGFLSIPVTAQWHLTGLKESTWFLLSDSSSNLLACTREGMLRSSDEGVTWAAVGYGLIYPNVLSAVLVKRSGGYLLFAGTESGVFRLQYPESQQWVMTSQWLPRDGITSMIAVDSLVFATTSRSGIFVSTDNGLHWLPSGTGLPSPDPFSIRTTSLTWFDGFLFVAAPSGMYRSSDRGQHWSFLNAGLPAGNVNSLTAVQGTLYAGTSAGVYRSSDHGASWSEAVGLSPTWIQSLGTDGTNLYAGLSTPQLFSLGAHGGGWVEKSEGLAFDANPINSIAVVDNTIFIATLNGVWARPNSDVTFAHAPSGVTPTGFELGQNYPNPFNGGTRINYTVGGVRDQGSGISVVRLAAYDLLGREVAVLVNERKPAGMYQVTFDATGLASGVYICHMSAGSYVQSRTMLLVR